LAEDRDATALQIVIERVSHIYRDRMITEAHFSLTAGKNANSRSKIVVPRRKFLLYQLFAYDYVLSH